jgi:membrane protease YdiL (CAAX protease family)
LNTLPENPQAPQPAAPALPDLTMGPSLRPAWNGWDILRILLIALVALVSAGLILVLLAPGPLRQRAGYLGARPELPIIAQMAAYLILLGYMYILVTRERRQPRFWQALHWNWPAAPWAHVGLGVLLQAVFLVVEATGILPFPKEVPFESLLKRPLTVTLVALFAVTLGPLLEELFFRGFLYPVVRHASGVTTAVLATALPFAAMHAAQYGYSWASVLLIFVVGVVLAAVRERRDSLAAAFLVHAGYNGTIVMLMFIATDGFRHLEKLNQ